MPTARRSATEEEVDSGGDPNPLSGTGLDARNRPSERGTVFLLQEKSAHTLTSSRADNIGRCEDRQQKELLPVRNTSEPNTSQRVRKRRPTDSFLFAKAEQEGSGSTRHGQAVRTGVEGCERHVKSSTTRRPSRNVERLAVAGSGERSRKQQKLENRNSCVKWEVNAGCFPQQYQKDDLGRCGSTTPGCLPGVVDAAAAIPNPWFREEVQNAQDCRGHSTCYARRGLKQTTGLNYPPARSCSGSLAANSGSASISGAGSGSLSLSLAGRPGQVRRTGRDSSAQAGDSGVKGLRDKVSASRPASCGESGVEAAAAGGSVANGKRSNPAASATGPPPAPAGNTAPGGFCMEAQGSSMVPGKMPEKRAEPRRGRDSSVPLIEQSASGGMDDNCPSASSGSAERKSGAKDKDEHLVLLQRLRRLPKPALESLAVNLLFKRYAALHGEALSPESLDAVEQPAPFLSREAPSVIMRRLMQTASQRPAKLSEGLIQQYTVPSLWEQEHLQPLSVILCTDHFVAARMPDEPYSGSDIGSAMSWHLARVDLPDDTCSAPRAVACSCGREKDAPLLWCRHVAGLVAAASSTDSSSPSTGKLAMNCSALKQALANEDVNALAELLFALSVVSEARASGGISCVMWLATQVARLKKGSAADEDSTDVGEASSAVGDIMATCPAAASGGGEELGGSIEDILERSQQLPRLPAAKRDELMVAMGIPPGDEIGDTCEAGGGGGSQADASCCKLGDQEQPGRDWEPATEEMLQKVWDLVAFGDFVYAWELLRELTSAASYSECWKKLREGMRSGAASSVVGCSSRPAAVSQEQQGIAQREPLLAALCSVWEACTNPAQRVVFFAPLWDRGVPTGRAAANMAAAPGWTRGCFSLYPHVGLVSLVGAVVGLVPGVLTGIAAAEALQERCATESRERHLGLVLSLGEQWTPTAAEDFAGAACSTALAPRTEGLSVLMEDLRDLAGVLSAHAVWEQQVLTMGDNTRTAVPMTAKPPLLAGRWDNVAPKCASGSLGRNSGSGSSSRAVMGDGFRPDAPGAPVPEFGSGSSRFKRSLSSTATNAQDPGSQGAQDGSAPVSTNSTPSLLWISAAALARCMASYSPSERLKVLAMLVPPPNQHNTGWRGQAALITCLAASTAADANMFLMGMMAVHHLSNVFGGDGAAMLNQLKLGCATLLALAPDEGSAIAGCYFMEICVAIAAVSASRGLSVPATPPSSMIGCEVVVEHALTTLLALLEREGAPGGGPSGALAAIQSTSRLVRRTGLPQVGRTITMQLGRWVRALVAAAHLQRPGGRLPVCVTIKSLDLLWLVGTRSGSSGGSGMDALLAEAGPMIVTAVSRMLGCILGLLESAEEAPCLAAESTSSQRTERCWAWPESWQRGREGTSMDPLFLAHSASFARVAAWRLLAAIEYRQAFDGSASSPFASPAFERVLLAPQLGALLGVSQAGTRARLAACTLLRNMAVREYEGLCASLVSAPGIISALVDSADCSHRATGNMLREDAQSFAEAGAWEDDASRLDTLEVTALEALWYLFQGPPRDSPHRHGKGAQPGQVLWRRLARQRVFRRLQGIVQRSLSRPDASQPVVQQGNCPRTGNPAAAPRRAEDQSRGGALIQTTGDLNTSAACTSTAEANASGLGSGKGPSWQQNTAAAGAAAGANRRHSGGTADDPPSRDGTVLRSSVFEKMRWALELMELLARYKPGLLQELSITTLEQVDLCGVPAEAPAAARAARSSAANLLALCSQGMHPLLARQPAPGAEELNAT